MITLTIIQTNERRKRKYCDTIQYVSEIVYNLLCLRIKICLTRKTINHIRNFRSYSDKEDTQDARVRQEEWENDTMSM
jgi:hypothetical protein